ncbi:hypothetical protein DAPPUDRAFT_105367 [Daphnia pulex]|uniref:Uncharacterized protein n=1 Tax=Daphnia pulex TaxID=6669 RepID=E9GQJ4_DAPPU|nr:hypothetical protein DAPPUDRAFT_105367 [Daphnia pulex]|eukprot:EFX78320.1 hypothetical protein DAPPUDRAFT_105367 [Daphnia pulex]
MEPGEVYSTPHNSENAQLLRCDGRVYHNSIEPLATVESHSFTLGRRAVIEFLFPRTESILPIQPINSATYQQRPTTSVAGSNVGKLPGTPPRPEPLAVPVVVWGSCCLILSPDLVSPKMIGFDSRHMLLQLYPYSIDSPTSNQYWKSPKSVILRATEEEEDGIVVLTFNPLRERLEETTKNRHPAGTIQRLNCLLTESGFRPSSIGFRMLACVFLMLGAAVRTFWFGIFSRDPASPKMAEKLDQENERHKCCYAGGGDVFHPEKGTGSLNLFQSSATTRSHATPMKGAVHWQQANNQRGSWVSPINVDWCSYIFRIRIILIRSDLMFDSLSKNLTLVSPICFFNTNDAIISFADIKALG